MGSITGEGAEFAYEAVEKLAAIKKPNNTEAVEKRANLNGFIALPF
jgi:hypothetical protein